MKNLQETFDAERFAITQAIRIELGLPNASFNRQMSRKETRESIDSLTDAEFSLAKSSD